MSIEKRRLFDQAAFLGYDVGGIQVEWLHHLVGKDPFAVPEGSSLVGASIQDCLSLRKHNS